MHKIEERGKVKRGPTERTQATTKGGASAKEACTVNEQISTS